MTSCSFWRSLNIQRRVVSALVLRETLTRYGRHNVGFIWLFLEPMLFVGVVTFVWSSMRDVQSFKLPVVAFAITGYCSLLLWRNMVNRCSEAMGPNVGLFFHRNVKVLDVFLSRIVLELFGATTSFVVLVVICMSLGLVAPPQDILKIVYGWALLSWFGASLALVVGCLSEKYQIVDKIWQPLAYLMLPFSGAAYMVDWLSPNFQQLALKFPPLHGVEMLREGYFGVAVRSHYDVGYVATVCLCLSFIGLVLAKGVAKNMSPS